MTTTRALRLMHKFSSVKGEDAAGAGGGSNVAVGGTLGSTTSASAPVGDKGSLSQLGPIPTGPLRKHKKKHETVICKSCGYPSVSEAVICPECGTQLRTSTLAMEHRSQHEDYRERTHVYRQNLIEGKTITESRHGWIPHVLATIKEELQKMEEFESLDEDEWNDLEAYLQHGFRLFIHAKKS
jgi:uncharacterized Zn finger protein (UPF0148 family)